VIGKRYSLYYSVWCSGEHELYDFKVRHATRFSQRQPASNQRAARPLPAAQPARAPRAACTPRLATTPRPPDRQGRGAAGRAAAGAEVVPRRALREAVGGAAPGRRRVVAAPGAGAALRRLLRARSGPRQVQPLRARLHSRCRRPAVRGRWAGVQEWRALVRVGVSTCCVIRHRSYEARPELHGCFGGPWPLLLAEGDLTTKKKSNCFCSFP